MKLYYLIFAIVLIVLSSCSKIVDDDFTGKDNVIIYGETFGLKENEGKNFLYDVNEILRVYSYGNNGEKIIYDQTDYNFYSNLNKIARTERSKIPNLNQYHVNFNSDGTFTYCPEPLNPPLIRQFHIFVDYKINKKCISIKPAKNSFFKMNDNSYPRIAIFGDSIANAEQTTSKYFCGKDSDGFSGLLRAFLTKEYGVCNVCVDNHATTGSSIDLFIANKEEVLSGNYNTVIIEYGMNDHLTGIDGKQQFCNKIDEICDFYKNKGIYVVLVGFFLENECWDLEKPVYPAATLEYNMAIKKMADKYGFPFIDIYSKFEMFALKKNIIEDMTADWMHHPTDFGHKVYFSMILPFFLKEEMESNYVENWILY